MRNIVILISGRGTNMQAIVNAAVEEQWACRIAAVISSRADAEGLVFAAGLQIPVTVVASKDHPSRDSFDAALLAAIEPYAPDLVVLAGFMRILTPRFVEHYQGRMINIHPSLLPRFPGLATHRQALTAGVTEHGATVHFVTADLDHGPVIAQAMVVVEKGDTEQVLSDRVLQQEHLLYPQVVRWFIDGRLSLHDGQVLLAPEFTGAA
ncbi:phosphoribosylglycinamide formyltransferase [Actimicrobium sp. CCC2.4]|uniref:phosphoribosylglycinamide formyltransferase n=1 Tax=Actimicrobium sp. CCC2.4 TaxID=3048606 RepID=UPI002AC8D3E9|nr:phosphoribosylglycinamide formyltransferase [Actimicrobium sp. CCC2.4]MEB0134970.1 phosphoribosylglycinamide formyltransferase [Actimicrobium sp. CCC2.4]WPX31981.1 phosphoribosylglycinamide formyltransferase [Actimicrobium sp. CCC2.4]